MMKKRIDKNGLTIMSNDRVSIWFWWNPRLWRLFWHKTNFQLLPIEVMW